MSMLAEVDSVSVPSTCVDHVLTHLRNVGRQGHEGLGLWVGRQNGRQFEVTETIIPAQRHIRTANGVCVVTGPEELHRINVWLYRQRLTLLAQIHSHPGRAYHSTTDDEYAIATTVGCFSLVVPDYAREPFALRRVASYRLNARGVWDAVLPAVVEKIITIVG